MAKVITYNKIFTGEYTLDLHFYEPYILSMATKVNMQEIPRFT